MKYINISILIIVVSILQIVAAESDGPYVFYRNNKIIVKLITPSGPATQEYNLTDSVTLKCSVDVMQTSFEFPLREPPTIEPSSFPLPSKMFVTSDLEGEFGAMVMLLKEAGVIDNNLNWAYGDGHLVHNGDLFDRGTNVTECLWFFYKLEEEAKRAGGYIHFLIGNHEFMNQISDHRYVAQKYFNTVDAFNEKGYRALYAEDTEMGKWIRSKSTVIKIGDYIINHSGISPYIMDADLSFDEINSIVREKMDGINGQYTDLVIKSRGCFWYRGYFEDDDDGDYYQATNSEVAEVLNYYNGNRIIVGHSVVSNIKLLYDGKVVAIDLYHEDNFQDGFMKGFYFEINKGYIFNTEGPTTTLLFTDDIAAPSAPTLVYPDKGANGISVDPTFTWNASPRTTTYDLQVSTTSDFSSTVVDESDISGTSYAVNGLTNSTQYYWKVNAINAGGTSPWSEVWDFGVFATDVLDATIGLNQEPISFTVHPSIVNSESQAVTFYSISHDRRNAAMVIYDALGNTVFTGEYELPPSKSQFSFGDWNLRSTAGRKVGSGTYLAVLKTIDLHGAVVVLKAQIGVMKCK